MRVIAMLVMHVLVVKLVVWESDEIVMSVFVERKKL